MAGVGDCSIESTTRRLRLPPRRAPSQALALRIQKRYALEDHKHNIHSIALTMADQEMSENKQRQLAGQLYYAFTPENIAGRRRCTEAVNRFNNSGDASRRKRVELWRE